MATLGGYNPKGYSGKYSGKAGRNPVRNPQPGFGGSGGGGGKKGCPLFLLQIFVLASALIGGLGFTLYKFLEG